MLRVRDLQRIYRHGDEAIHAVDGVDLDVGDGEYLRVVGASGSGKSTLLNLLGGLDRPTVGAIGTPIGDLGALSQRELAAWRAIHVGMVFQNFNLIPHRTALQNVELGLLFAGVPRATRLDRARKTLADLGLESRLHHRPADLSGGEQQRVALARALVKRPAILLADEPTGNLDRENAAQIASTLSHLCRAGMTIVLVTHDPALAAADGHRTVRMSYGKIVEETVHGAPGAAPGGDR